MTVLVGVGVAGPRDIEVVLQDWLRAVPELRGRVHRRVSRPAPGAMGVAGDLVVALASTGAAAALARSLQTWLVNRHSDVTVTLTTADGRQVSVTADRVNDLGDVQDLLNAALAAGEGSDQAPEPPDRQPPEPPDRQPPEPPGRQPPDRG